MVPKGKPMKLRNKQRTAGQDTIDRHPDDLLQQSEQVLLEVLDALENASVDPLERKIVWADASRLSVEETVRRIHAQSGMPLDGIESHLIGWLEMIYEPQGLNENQMEEFELLIEHWIRPYDEAL
jgi:hypothetical protein